MLNLLILPKHMNTRKTEEMYSRYRTLARGGNLRIIRDLDTLDESMMVGEKHIRGWIHKDCKGTDELASIMLYIYNKKEEMGDDPDGFFERLSNEGFIL